VVILILFKVTQALELRGVIRILTNLLWGVVIALLSLQEVGRTPFDLPEGERELVSGFNTELRAAYFTLVFLREYGRLIFMGHFRALVVIGGHPLGALVYVMGLLYARRVLPRARVEKALGLSFRRLGLILLGALMALVRIRAYRFGS
jgi:NADH:ubiquinone oxidoreductase subunit H